MKYSRKIKRYLKHISWMIPADYYPDKKQFLHNLKSDVRSFLEEHTDAVWQDVLEEFGTTVDVAGAALGDSMNTDIISVVRQKNRLHRWIIVIIAVFIAAILILIGYRGYWIKYRSYKVNPTVYIYDGTEVSSEEFYKEMEND